MTRREAMRIVSAAAFCPALANNARSLAQAAGTGRLHTIGPEQQALAGMPEYRPQTTVQGVLRLWGHGSPKLDFMGKLAHAWQTEFEELQPGVRFEYDMYGTASAMGALYTGAGDVAILGQEIYGFESRTFERVKGYPPFMVNIATGSRDVRNFDFAMVVFVHADNPISGLTLDQLNCIFAWQPEPSRNVTAWGQLGLRGEWRDCPIHLYSWRADDAFSTFLQNRVLHGSHEWRCGVQEFAHIHNSDGSIYDSGQQILDHLARDPAGIAFSNYRYSKEGVKPVPIAWKSGGPYWLATTETLIHRQYPLGRMIPAVIDRKPGTPIRPAVREFLLYLLSRQGQQQIVSDGKYLPLSPEAAHAARERLV